MSKLNPQQEYLWQKPKKKVTNRDAIWYDNVPVGKDPLNNAMKTLSTNAGLSKQYRNHSIRATVVTNLDQKGFEARHIMATTGHKSEVSIKNYARKCPTQKRRELSDALAKSMTKEVQQQNENTPKKFKPNPEPVINTPTFNLEGAELGTINEHDFNNIFGYDDPLVELQEVMDLVAQIESENNSSVQKAESPKTPKTPKTYNVSNIANIANINRLPLMPNMIFPHSNVTINYNFK